MKLPNLDQLIDFLKDENQHYDHPIYKYDMYFYAKNRVENHWKLSIQGNKIEDSVYLLTTLHDYLIENDIHFKVATKTRFNLINREVPQEKELQYREQSKKAMTIYCPINKDIKELAKEVSALLEDYTGYEGVSHPTSYEHYSGGVYFRKDKDENGNYIRAN